MKQAAHRRGLPGGVGESVEAQPSFSVMSSYGAR
jgi:hypothetical protein